MRDTILADLRLAWRTLPRAKGFLLAALLSLALGIGSVSTLFSLVHAVVFAELPYRDADRLVDVSEQNPAALCAGCAVGMSWPAYDALTRGAASLESLGAAIEAQSVVEGTTPERVSSAFVSASLFPTLGVAPERGRGFTAAEDSGAAGAGPGSDVVLVSHGLAVRRFGGIEVVGKDLLVDGRALRITGVMPRGFRYPERAELWRPLAAHGASLAPHDRGLTVVGRLAPGVSPAALAAELASFGKGLAEAWPATQTGWTVGAVSLRDDLLVDSGPPFYLPFAAGLLVLLVACANLANLLLARGLSRQRELTLRLALGATRFQIARQVLVESLLVSLAGGALGLLLATQALPLVTKLLPASLPFWIDIRLHPAVLAFTVALSLATGALFGLLPALAASRQDPARALNDGGPGATFSPAKERFRSALVVAQAALALALLSGAGLLAKTFLASRGLAGLGYEAGSLARAEARLLATRYDSGERRVAFARDARERLSAVPGVSSVALESAEFVGAFTGSESRLRLEGSATNVPLSAAPSFALAVDGPYVETLGLRVLAGRTFRSMETEAVALLGSAAASRLFGPGAEAVGRRILIDAIPGSPAGLPEAILPDRPGDEANRPATWLTVVGVVSSPIGNPVRRSESAFLYVPFAQRPGRDVTFRLRTPAPEALPARSLAAAIAEVDPAQPLEGFRSEAAFLADWAAPTRFLLQILGGLAVAGVLLAALGLFGLATYRVAAREREIGIRMALGADARRVVREVLGGALRLAGFGILLGLGLSALVGRALSSVLFGASPLDPVVLVGVSALLLGVAALASLVPARRAAAIDPVHTLRSL
ncbi:MAG: ABC transporter permease [Acidobacteria bacterium]|nr:ABC transporter permease [Acidobacteriota bacterium]